jgi:hypothetical protein
LNPNVPSASTTASPNTKICFSFILYPYQQRQISSLYVLLSLTGSIIINVYH